MALFGFIFIAGCGITEPKYVEYEPIAQKPEPKPACTAGLDAFTTNLAGVMTKCVGCHGIAGNPALTAMPLSNDNAANRNAILGSKQYPDVQKLINFISGSSHPGSSIVVAGDKTAFQAWASAESTCQTAS